jgi:hypothetical protein
MSNTNDNDAEAVWKIVKKVRIAMMVTRNGEEYEGRPLSA